MKKSASFVFFLLILGVAFGATWWLFGLRKPPEKKINDRPMPTVVVLVVERRDTAIEIPSQGLVEPWRESRLAAQVGGLVKSVSAKLETGERVDAGEVLVELDATDYHTQVAAAEARVADAALALANEEAAAAQAKRDWERLNLGGIPTPLTLREPQLAAARANVAAAEAALAKATLDVGRTRICAPFAGNVRAKLVEEGMVVMPGTAVAEIYSTASFKVRLAVSVDDAVRVQRREDGSPMVRFFAKAGGQQVEWGGRIVRTEGDIDRSSRSLYFVGELSPVGQSPTGLVVPMLPGLFLDAVIQGRTLESVVRLPRSALLDNRRVLIIDADNILHYREVVIAWSSRDEVYVASGLENGERVCLTTVESVINGVTKVKVATPVDEPAGKSATR